MCVMLRFLAVNSCINFRLSTLKTFEGRFDVEVAACLAVVRVARAFGVTAATPKWPNDVWVKGHKLAGFLVEDGRFNIPGERERK